MALLRIAFRNLLRARRRNLLSGGTMVLGTAALVLGSGLSDGIARQLTKSLVDVQSGHVQVVVRPDEFERQNSPFDVYGEDLLPGAAGLAARIESEGRAVGVRRAVPYLHGRGSAVAGSRSSPVSITGVIVEREGELASALPPEAGSFLPAGDRLALYVASPLARKLRVGVGDTVSLVVQTAQGAVNSHDGTVSGIFGKAAPWHDNGIYLPLEAAQALFAAEGAATNIKLSLDDSSRASAHRARDALQPLLDASVPLSPGLHARAEAFDEAGRFFFSIIQANQTALFILSSFLFLAAAVGVVNAMLMSVHERTREIGTVRALGMRRSAVIRMFVMEGVALGAVSAALGLLLGGSIVSYYGWRGIPMNTMTLAWLAGGDRLFPVLEPQSLARAALSIAGLSTLAALYPAHTASRLEPREALQHV